MPTPTLIHSSIQTVKLYAAGATVIRYADLNLSDRPLPTEVEIAGLPLSLEDSSVRVRVESNGTQQAIATDLRVGLSVPPRPGLEAPTLEEEIRQATLAVQRLEDQISTIHHEIATLQRLTVPERPTGEDGKAPPPSPIQARLTLARFKDEQIRTRRAERRSLDESLRQARATLADLLHRQTQAMSDRAVKEHELRKAVTVRLEWSTAEPDSAHQLVLEYRVPGARWTPTYVCRLDSKTRQAAIALRALICQRTGEDWSGVQLQLSTAEPSAWCELPELPSLRLGRAQPQLAKAGWRSAPVGADLLFADYDRQRLEAAPTAPSVLTDDHLERVTVSPVLPIAEQDTNTEVDFSSGEMFMEDGGYQYASLADDWSPLEKEYEEDYSAQERSLLGAAGSTPPTTLPVKRAAKMAAPASPQMAEPDFAAPAPIQHPPSLSLQPELLDYGLLRLGAADDGKQRGKLSLPSPQQRYRDTLEAHQAATSFAVMEVVQRAIAEAQGCLALPLPSGSLPVRTLAQSFDYAYSADGRVDVPSDGQFHSVALTHQTADLILRYVVVPREDPSVFRLAQLCNPFPSPLLAGPVDVYVDQEYVLTSQIETVPPRGQIELGLGVEQAIKVARNTSFEEVRAGKILVAFNELRHRIQIAIANPLPQPIEIEVRERLPVPKEGEKVDVEVDSVSPAWEPYNQSDRHHPIRGGYRWHVQVGSREQVTLAVQYTIKTYADSELIGGNRREG